MEDKQIKKEVVKPQVLNEVPKQVEKEVQVKKIYIVDNCSELNCREQPTLTGKVLTRFKQGTEVNVLPYANDKWYKVAFNDLCGYCLKDFIKVK